MFWKRWPSWLKGGLIGAGLTLLAFTFFYSCTQLNLPSPSKHGTDIESSGWDCLPFLVISPILPIALLFDQFNLNNRIPFATVPIASLLVWFLIGGLFGALHNRGTWKRKNRKRPPER